MADRRRGRTLLAVLVLVSLTLLTVDYRQGDGGSVAAIQRGALAVFAPVQEGFATVVRPLGDAYGAVAELGRLRQRNQALEADLEQLRQQRRSLADLKRENEELRALLGMSQEAGLTTTGARVIARPPSAFEWSVLIDAGVDGGVRPGMAVLSGQGLVGKVTEVAARHARVQLLVDPVAGYAVRLADSGEEGLLSGRGASPLQLEVIDPEAELAPGAEVVTRAFEGTSIPDGIPVGVVDERVDPDAPPTRFLPVRPYADLTRLNHVQVVLDAPEQPADLDPEVPAPSPEQPPAAPGELDPPPAPPGGLDAPPARGAEPPGPTAGPPIRSGHTVAAMRP